MPELNDGTPTWPVWDYVTRTMRQEHQDVDDALEVLRSLPTWTVPVDGGHGRRYGLVWYTDDMGGRPQLDSKIGLTIAGLHLLGAANYTSVAEVANAYAGIVGAIARADDRLDPTPSAPATGEVQLSALTGALGTPTIQRQVAIPDQLTVDLLVREAALIEITGQHGGPATVHLGKGWARRFRKVSTSAEYLELVEEMAVDWDRQPHSSPLGLVQTFDYLGLVLEAHSEWPLKRLTLAPDLESAAALGVEVSTLEEFQTAISSLGTILDQLNIPPIPKDERDQNADPAFANASINRLEHWLNKHVVPVQGGVRVSEAIRTLRDVRDLRTAEQHPSHDKEKKAVAARKRFGIPEFVVDFGSAWRQVRAVVAGALDLIRQEVQAAQRSCLTQD